ncbi:hypothetical protein HM25_002486 [Salmonella enterica subsp. enterica serovar Carno]|nr:hypothetical protein [Salmonella enterica subsp. enterica serovar Carno]
MIDRLNILNFFRPVVCKTGDCHRFRHGKLARAETEQREAQPDDELRLKYDGRGLLVTEENRAGKHEHEYDPLGNLLTTTLPDGRRIENLYYGSGHLLETQLRDGEHIFQLVEYERDNLHREVHRRQGNVWRQTEYDLTGRRTAKRAHRRWTKVVEETTPRWAGMRLYGEQQPDSPEVLFTCNADIVVRDNKTGEIIAIETKTGKATRAGRPHECAIFNQLHRYSISFSVFKACGWI